MQINKLKNLIEQNNNGAGDLVIAEGLHAVKHALRFEAQLKDLVCRNKVDIIKLAQKLCPDVLDLLNQYLVEIGDDFDKLSKSKIRTGILGIFKKPRNHSQLIGGWDEGLKVLLDSPKDLNNIGAVIRVCAAAGIKNLIITGETNPWNTRAIRAAAGLQFAMEITKLNSEEITKLKLPLISFDERGKDLNSKLKKQIPSNAILTFGSERDGISEELKLSSDLIVRLAMREGVSSLNLATSVAAALYSLK